MKLKSCSDVFSRMATSLHPKATYNSIPRINLGHLHWRQWQVEYPSRRRRSHPTEQGRWSYVTISGRDAPNILFISAYRVCQKARSKAGPLTSYAQQWTMSHIAGNPNPDPRNDFISDLIQFVQEKRRLTPLAVNITLDANEHMGEEATGLQRLTTILGLTGVHGNKLGDKAPATYTQGSKQIDYGLVCSGLLPYVIRCGFGAFHDGPVTDHR